MCSLRDAAKDFDALGVKVYGSSLDDVATQAKFAADQKLDFQLLSDPDGSAAKKYGVLKGGRRYPMRMTFVLDRKGVLRHISDKVDVVHHGADLVKLIKDLQG